MVLKLQNGEYYYQTTNLNDGTTYNIRPSAFGAKELKVTTPEVVVTAPRKRAYSSAFDPTAAFEPVHGMLDLMGKAFGKATDATGTTKAAQTVMPWLMPSQYIGWMRTGNRPGTEGNTGFGESKQDQYLNEMFDLGTSPALMKGVGKVTKPVRKTVTNGLKNAFRYPWEAIDINSNAIYNPGKWFFRLKETKLPDGRTRFTGESPYFNVERPLAPVTSAAIEDLFNTTKTRFLKYYKSPEFKQRALKAGFTEEEMPKLLNEIEERINNTSFSSDLPTRGAKGLNRTHGYKGSMRPTTHTITIDPYATGENMTQTMWHEFQHSIGGNLKGENAMRYPMLDRLRKYNDSLLPTERNTLYTDLTTNPDKVTSFIARTGKYPGQVTEAFTKGNKRYADWLRDEIANKSVESRSRVSLTLDWLRRQGYDTSKLIEHPEKFTEIVEDLQKRGVDVNVSLNELLGIYGNSKGLANYFGRMLSGTGAVYLGSQMLNNQ